MKELIKKEVVDDVTTLMNLDNSYKECFDRRIALKAYVIASTMIVENIPDCPVVLVGMYCKKYRDLHYKNFTNEKGYFMYKDMSDFIKREGMSVAYRGIETLFSPALKWVNGGHMKFLTNVNLFYDFVFPNIKKRGEQAEWGGSASTEKGCKEVRI